ncbi:MAG: hypothetical protein C0506_01445 [Anaerolinea sp.]|nr:hypothetical protein [Anaerolinea sp.]
MCGLRTFAKGGVTRHHLQVNFIATATTGESAGTLAVALGIGLLMGLERERRKGSGPTRQFAGVRTFALVSLLGGISAVSGDGALVAVAAAFVASVAALGYALGPRDDPGLTSEVALMVAFVLGALAQEEPALAAACGVVVTILLASRERLHHLIRDAMSEQEFSDLLLFAAAAVVVFPLLPDGSVGPYGGLNPRTIWRLVVLVMAIGGTGYVALRLLGPAQGLPITGLAGGFISSAATTASMGAISRADPALLRPAIAGAVLSNVATIIQLGVVVGAASVPLLRSLWLAIVLSAAAAILFAAAGALRLRGASTDGATPARRRAFDPKSAILFAATVSGVTLAASAVNDWFGSAGLLLAAGLAGFADAHAAAAAVAALVANGEVSPSEGVLPVAVGLTTNTLTKLVAAYASGGGRFARPLLGGLVTILGMAWAGALAMR